VRLVGYPRDSTRGQVKAGASIPYQDREIRAWARRDGHRIVGMFPEEGRSGALEWMRFARLVHRPVRVLADLRSAQPAAAVPT
jgi:hypothetical protein